jgi:hypothetical protein
MRCVRVCLVVSLVVMGSCADNEFTEESDLGFSKPDAADVGTTPLIDTFVPPDNLPPADKSCAASTISAKQTPTAVLIVLDRSSSMTTNKKWGEAQKAIVKAIDKDSFDNVNLGLLAYPMKGTVKGPACIWSWPVSCGVSALPQVALANSGTSKTNGSTGPRKAIYSWLTSNSPDNTGSDASPGYDAMKNGYDALQDLTKVDKRALVLLTDGGFSCASLSSPTRPGYTDGACPDWEYPASVVKLIKAAKEHTTKPISTFIVGLPGSDSTGKNQGGYATAPYQMLLALSTYAWTGSPKTVPATCNGKAFTKTGWAPTQPCHFDMTQGTFNADALAKAFAQVKGKVLGCTYKLPKVDDKNKTIDKTKVNVQIALDGKSAYTIPRRSNKTDTCLVSKGCWDLDASDNVAILGKGCTDLSSATQAKVSILVGCKTIVK